MEVIIDHIRIKASSILMMASCIFVTIVDTGIVLEGLFGFVE
jgi:hypothetical protein